MVRSKIPPSRRPFVGPASSLRLRLLGVALHDRASGERLRCTRSRSPPCAILGIKECARKRPRIDQPVLALTTGPTALTRRTKRRPRDATTKLRSNDRSKAGGRADLRTWANAALGDQALSWRGPENVSEFRPWSAGRGCSRAQHAPLQALCAHLPVNVLRHVRDDALLAVAPPKPPAIHRTHK
jgi:hypothetical protein